MSTKKKEQLKKNQHSSNKGFTLVELIVVIVILAILAAILAPSLLDYIDRAKENQIITNANAVYKAAQATASEYYAKGISSDTGDKTKRTDTHGIWIPVTNDMGTPATTKSNQLPYIRACYDLVDAKSMPAFYAVAVTTDDKPGMVYYMTYYDVKSGKVAYWDYQSKSWTIKTINEKPGGSNWNHVKYKNGENGGESFTSYYLTK